MLHQFASVLIYVLLGAAVVSLLLGDWLEFGAILVIAVLNAVLGFAQEYRADRALAALRELAAPTATVVRRVRASKGARSWSLNSTTRGLRGPDIHRPPPEAPVTLRPDPHLSSTIGRLTGGGT